MAESVGQSPACYFSSELHVMWFLGRALRAQDSQSASDPSNLSVAKAVQAKGDGFGVLCGVVYKELKNDHTSPGTQLHLQLSEQELGGVAQEWNRSPVPSTMAFPWPD